MWTEGELSAPALRGDGSRLAVLWPDAPGVC